MKAIVHIGTEKTGTTSIQGFLFQNRRKLRSAGYHVIQSAGRNDHRALPAYCISDDRVDDFYRNQGIQTLEERNAFKADFLARFEAELRSLPAKIHTVLISSEHFHSRIRTEEEMDNVHRLLSTYFDDIKIVCYLREQVTTCTSYYSTSLKSGGTSGFVEFMERCNPDNYYFNYLVMLANWERCFGREALDVALFDRDRFLNRDLLDDFTARIDPKLVGKLNTNVEAANESISPAGQAIALGVNRAFPIRTVRKELGPIRENCKKLIYRRMRGRGRQLSLEAQREMFDAFAECNEQLRQKFFPHEKTLFEPPNAQPVTGFELDDTFLAVLVDVLNIIRNEGKGLLDAGEYANACLQVVSSVLDMSPEFAADRSTAKTLRLTDNDARLLVRAATRLEKRDLQASVELMNLALQIDPQLPRVIDRLEENRQRLEEKAATQKFVIWYCLDRELDEEQNKTLGPRWAEWLKSMDTGEGSFVKRIQGTCRVNPDGSVDEIHSEAPKLFTIIEAASLVEAIEEARRCPFLDYGVSVEVSRIGSIIERPLRKHRAAKS